MGAYGKLAAKKAANKKHRAVRSRNNSQQKPSAAGQAASVDTRDTQASHILRVVPQDGAARYDAGHSVLITESAKSTLSPPSYVRMTPMQPSLFLEPAGDDTTLCHLEPKERSRLRQDMTTFVTHTSSCKPLERSCAITQISASVPRLGEAPTPSAPLQAPAAGVSADEQRYTNIPAVEHSSMQLQEQHSADAPPFQAIAADISAAEQRVITLPEVEHSSMPLQEQRSSDTPPFEAAAADVSADEQRYTTIPAVEHSSMQLQEQHSADAPPFQAIAADISAAEQRVITLPEVEHSSMPLQEQGLEETPREDGSLETIGTGDTSPDDAAVIDTQTAPSHPATTKIGGLLTQLFRSASSMLSKLSSTAASSGRCAAQTALTAGAVPIKAAASATAAAAGLSLAAAVGSAAVVMTAAGFTASAVAPVVESSVIQLPLKTASYTVAPVATLFLKPVAAAATSIGSVGMHAIKSALAVAAHLFPKTAKYIRCKLSASPSLEDLEGGEWLARRQALLEAAVADYANSSQESDGEDSMDEDESDEEGDMDLKDMDSAFQPSAAKRPNCQNSKEVA